jgi:Chromo (CHRromatin Organisation MOdifier) domain
MIHPVFHVSQLKKKVGAVTTVHSKLPVVGPEGKLRIEPLVILDRRTVKKRNQPVTEVLIQWSNLAEEDATWESWNELLKQFPDNCLEDKTNSKEGAMSAISELGTVVDKFDFVKLIEGGTSALESLGREATVKELGQETAKSDEAHVVTELSVQMEKTGDNEMEKV